MSGQDLTALQAALAAEQAIVYGFGIVGSHLPLAVQPALQAILVSHEQRRDQLADLIRQLGGEPVAPRIAYRLPFRVESAASARRLAHHLESGGAGAAWDLVAATTPESTGRRVGVDWLTAAVRAEFIVTGSADALPGRPAG